MSVLLWSIRFGAGLAAVFVLVVWFSDPDLNGDGVFTYQDALAGWAWVYHLPAGLILMAVAVAAPGLLPFFEVSLGGSGLLWNLFSLVAWLPVLVSLVLFQTVSARVALERKRRAQR